MEGRKMNRIKVFCITLACMVCVTGVALAQEGGTSSVDSLRSWVDGAVSSVETWVRDSGELEVRRQAIRKVTPDTVSINVGVRAENADEKIASEEANSIINQVTAAIRALGVEENQIATSGFSIRRDYSSSSRLVPNKYVASNSLRVTVQDFALINQILDTALELGANDIGNISFSYSKENEVYHEALADAIVAAKGKAQAMAKTAGVELYTLMALREGGGAAPMYYNAMEMSAVAGGAGMGTEIMAGEIEISATVTMVYQIK